MNREETQEAIEAMEHFANGGEVEVRHKYDGEWVESKDPWWNWKSFDYRIKKYISNDFKNKIEKILSELDCYDEVEFYVPNEGASREMQDILFSDGFRWSFSKRNASHTNARYLYVDKQDMDITCTQVKPSSCREFLCYSINLESETITDLRPKVVEMTMEELIVELGYEVKIKKGN